MLIERAIERVRQFRTRKNWPPARLAREAGLSLGALRRMDDEDWSPTADTLRKLEALIGDDDEEGAADGLPSSHQAEASCSAS